MGMVYSVQILAEILRTRVLGLKMSLVDIVDLTQTEPDLRKIVGFFVFSSLHRSG
jgi:hypothetical protein